MDKHIIVILLIFILLTVGIITDYGQGPSAKWFTQGNELYNQAHLEEARNKYPQAIGHDPGGKGSTLIEVLLTVTLVNMNLLFKTSAKPYDSIPS